MIKIDSVSSFIEGYFKDLFFGKDHKITDEETHDFYAYKEHFVGYWLPKSNRHRHIGHFTFGDLTFKDSDVDKFQELYYSEQVEKQKIIRTAIKQAINDVEERGYHDHTATLIILPEIWVKWFNNYPFKNYITEKYEDLELSNPFTVSKEKGSLLYYIPYTTTNDPKIPPMVLSDCGEYKIIEL
jgi:hypothetical protein